MRLALVLGCLLTAGCGTTVAPVTPTAVADADVPPAFRNDQGKLACPVMGDVVESPERSAGHLDHAGVRYYFCCNSCQVLFEDDPEKYVDGRYLKELGKMSGGMSDASSCEAPAEP